MKRILFIPHHPAAPGVKIRINELAAAMAGNAEVYLLSWRAADTRTMLNRVFAALKDAFMLPSARQEGKLTNVTWSILRRPIWLARRYNRLMLARAVRRLSIDVVVNGSYYLFSAAPGRTYGYIVDLADLPADPAASYVELYTRTECQTADAVTAASPALAAYARTAYGCRTHWIPNGADLAAMSAVSPEEVTRLRAQLNLSSAYIVGYIGYIGQWVNVPLAVRAFHRFRENHPDAVLLFIGSAPNLDLLRRTYASPQVRFIGPVGPPIEPWFKILDMGILPNRRTPFQDMAFHLKLIEYTAAGIPVVSTDMQSSVDLDLPNVLCVDEQEDTWTDALLRGRAMPRDPSWRESVRSYDWSSVAARFSGIIEELR